MNPGREFIRGNGERHYINHDPRFSVHYLPRKDLDQVLYREGECEYMVNGWKLLRIYEALKDSTLVFVKESEGDDDSASDEPHIRDIEFLVRGSRFTGM